MRNLLLMFLVVFTTTIFAASASAQNLQNGLIAHWEFDGNADDSSGNGYNATENGDVAYTAGRFGQALDLENDGAYLAVENNVDIQLKTNEEFSVSAHIQPTDTAHGDILYHGLGCSTWASWFLGMQGGEPDAPLVVDSLVFAVRTSNGSAYTGVSTESGFGEWIHVAATHNGSVLTLYVDGEEVDIVETGDLPYASNEKLHIGGDPGCGGRSWYTGQLDDLRLYNRALSKAEIAILAENGGFAVDSTGKLAAVWGGIKRD